MKKAERKIIKWLQDQINDLMTDAEDTFNQAGELTSELEKYKKTGRLSREIRELFKLDQKVNP